jgi:hypothetical protein
LTSKIDTTITRCHGALVETGHLVPKRAAKDELDFASHLVLKGKLGARKQTNSDIRIGHRGKTARVVKTRRY